MCSVDNDCLVGRALRMRRLCKEAGMCLAFVSCSRQACTALCRRDLCPKLRGLEACPSQTADTGSSTGVAHDCLWYPSPCGVPPAPCSQHRRENHQAANMGHGGARALPNNHKWCVAWTHMAGGQGAQDAH